MDDVTERLGALLGASSDPERFVRLCERVRDWDALLARASEHEVGSVLYHHVLESGFDLPVEADRRARHERFMLSAAPRPEVGDVVRLVGALGQAGVAVVPLKGPVLAERLYPDPALRRSADLDLLVAAGDFDRAAEALAGLGFTLSDTAARARYHREHHIHLVFLPPEQPHLVELHFRALRAFGVYLDAEPLLDRAVTYTASTGDEVRVLAPEDEVVYLAAHAAKHFVVHLKWLYDIELLRRRHVDLDWEVVAERARDVGLSRAVSFVLGDLIRYLGTDAPAGGAVPLGLRAAAAGAMRSFGARYTGVRPVTATLGLAYGAALGDRLGPALTSARRNVSRIARRRLRRYFPWATPEDWSG